MVNQKKNHTKLIEVWVTNKEKKDLVNQKGDLTWRQYILQLAELNKQRRTN